MLIQSDEMIKEMKANRIHLSTLTPNTISVKDSDTSEAITGNRISATDGKTSCVRATSLQEGGEETREVLDCVEVENVLQCHNSDSIQPLEESKFTTESSSVNYSFPDERDGERNGGIVDAVSPIEETNSTSSTLIFNQERYTNSTVNCDQLSSGCKQLRTEETQVSNIAIQ